MGTEENFDHNNFWKMITFEERFELGKSKESAIRNPVLRPCEHYGIELNEDHKVPGEMFLTYDVLAQMEVIKRDQNHYAYLYEAACGDHFPLPSPALTKIDGWEYRNNWKMDTPAHHRVVAAFPARPLWQIKHLPWGGPFLDPGTKVGTSQDVALPEGAEEEEDNALPRGASYRYQQLNRGSRRTRVQRAEDFEESATFCAMR